MRKSVQLMRLLLLLLSCFLCAVGSAAADSQIYLVFDASGSMWQSLPGASNVKVRVAQDAVQHWLQTVPESIPFGLAVYGAHRADDCLDVDIVAAKAGQISALTEQLKKINPTGKGAMIAALEAVFEKVADAPATIVLLSDGREVCVPHACERIKAAKAKQPGLTVHTIALRAEERAQEELRCIAEATAGSFASVDSEKSLSDAFSALPLSASNAVASNAPEAAVSEVPSEEPAAAQEQPKDVVQETSEASVPTEPPPIVEVGNSIGRLELQIPPESIAQIKELRIVRQVDRRIIKVLSELQETSRHPLFPGEYQLVIIDHQGKESKRRLVVADGQVTAIKLQLGQVQSGSVEAGGAESKKRQ